MSFRATETDSIREPRTVGVRAFLGYLEEVATDTYRPTASRSGATHMHALLEDGDIHVVPLGPDTGGVVQRMVGDTVILYATLPPPVPAWPVVDADIEVFPGDDLVAIVNAAPAGSDIYLHRNLDGTAYTHDIGAAELAPVGSGHTIRAAAPATVVRDATRGVYGIAPWVRITGSGNRIINAASATNLTLYGLEIDGATYDGSDQTTGRGVHRGTGEISYCLLHHNDNAAIGGTFSGSVHHNEFCYNSAADISGIAAAIKTTDPLTAQHNWFHHNYKHAIWLDCEGTDFIVTDNVIEDEAGTGIFYEISKGPALVARNLIRNCNTGNTAGRGGMIVTSSKNITIEDNVFDGNNVQNLRIWEDGRFQNGDASCTSGYYLEGIVVTGNTIASGVTPRLLFNGQSTISVNADATYPNPHGGAPAGAEVVFTGNTY